MNKKLVIGILVFILLGAAAGYKLLNKRPDGITATGTIEVTRVDITPKTNGYITGLSIIAGDRVTAGQTIVTIDRPDLKASLLRDQAALDKALAQLRDLEKGSRSQEIQEAAAAVSSGQSSYEKASEDLRRYQTLYQQGAISRQQLDAAQSAADVAQSSLVQAQAKLSLAREGNREDTITAQRLEVERSKAVVDASRSLLADTIVTAPLSGLVLTKNYENGEYVNAGSAIATIGNMEDSWVKIYIPSTQLGLIKIGQPAVIRVDSFPDRTFSGEIKEISQNSEYTPRQSLTENERANMVFAVKVKINNAEGILKPGMPADVVLK
ncbi:MAG TPA: efflux RND transporter periplasmic adaptor subunit [Methylomusa anaerophila]|uniref:Multidrug resistance protein MdtN n=1 Tax=Methylomusa anaerophila TaxID=1930071 RepID=A0A348AJM6_9FIRM|nr:efflux RND transporter periplasmic adaptor subunit [Methylomusa anaerophila]BBB91274.1 multidrug resistance protein MdtN [Methylomusa anaerophila]HML89731.1 efflux RND transporter periplasmic adaptor subunit [Methylomusa anaerophila]